MTAPTPNLADELGDAIAWVAEQEGNADPAQLERLQKLRLRLTREQVSAAREPQTHSKSSKPTSSPFEEMQKRALVDIRDRSADASAEPRSTPAFESAAALLDREFPKTPWMVRGLLVDKAVGVVGGEPKTAKTWSAMELAMAVATGTKAFDEFTTGDPRHVALFLVEDDPRATRNRLRALAVGRGLGPVEALQSISVKCRGHMNLEDERDLAWLIASVRSLASPPALLVLDPLRDLHTGKENDSDSMAPVMGRLRLLRDLLGCAIVFVHHTSKAGEATNARRPGQRMRGSSVVHASVDGGLYLSNLDTDGATRFKSTADVELKAVRGAGQFSLQLDVTDNDDGEAIEAKWTIEKSEGPAAKGDNLDQVQAAVLKVLKTEWLMATGEVRPLTTGALQDKLKRRKDTVGAACNQLLAEQKVTQAFQKRKAIGWLYVPRPGEKTTSSKVGSGLVPDASEPTVRDRFPPSIEEPTREPVGPTPVGSGTNGVHGGPA